MSQTIICPSCNTSIDLDKMAEHKYEKIKEEQEKKLKIIQAEQEKVFQEKLEKTLEAEKIQMRKQLKEYSEKKVLEERKKVELEMKDMENQLKDAEVKQKEAQELQLEFMKKKREFEEKEKNQALELEKKLQIESEKLEIKLKERQKEQQEILEKKLQKKQDEILEEKLKKAEIEQIRIQEKIQEEQKNIREKEQEAFRKKELELLKQQEQMKKALDEAKRKAEQGSQQIQGDIQEDDLKNLLEHAFPFDSISDVPTGIRGADLVQNVHDNFGRKKGIMLWESKNTKSWQESWLKKLKDDQAEAKADICILATTTLPKDVQNFACKDGVWVVDYRFALSLAHILRSQILEISKVKTSLEGRDEKMDFLYQYLSGPQFRNRIENIVSAFTGMQTDLLSEKRAMQRIWSKREKEIDRMINNTSGLYGDMQGIIALPTIENLELPEGLEA